MQWKPHPSFVLATGPDAIERALRFPVHLSSVFKLFGFTCVILGVMGYFTARHGDPKRKWGLWICFAGTIFVIVGLRPDILLSLLKYMIPS